MNTNEFAWEKIEVRPRYVKHTPNSIKIIRKKGESPTGISLSNDIASKAGLMNGTKLDFYKSGNSLFMLRKSASGDLTFKINGYNHGIHSRALCDALLPQINGDVFDVNIVNGDLIITPRKDK